jgi:cubilin
LTSPRGVIASPLHPEVYPHGATCRWIVRAGPGKVVRLQWLSFALEPAPPACHFDSVSVYDNSTIPNTGGLVGRYCGNTLPPSITSTGDTITIVFKSDASLAAEGFTLTYITLNSSSRNNAFDLIIITHNNKEDPCSLRRYVLHRNGHDCLARLPHRLPTLIRLYLDHSCSS